MSIEIIDLSNVIVDGANFGAVADTIANNPKLAPEIQIALQQWWQAQQAQFETEKAAIAAQQQQAVEAAIANAQSNADIADYQAQIATLTQELDALKNPPPAVENWAGLADDLIKSSLLLKVQQVGTVSGAANMGYTSLGFILFGIQSYERFISTVKVIRLALAEVGKDFTTEELDFLDGSLVKNGFSALPKTDEA